MASGKSQRHMKRPRLTVEQEKCNDRNSFHSTILTYTNFNKLLRLLENSTFSNLPDIEYPSVELMETLLALTSLGPECTADIAQIDDKGYGNRGLNLRSLDLLHRLIQTTEPEDEVISMEDDKLSELLGGSSWVKKTAANKADSDNVRSNVYRMVDFISSRSHASRSKEKEAKAQTTVYEEILSSSDNELDSSDIDAYGDSSASKKKQKIVESNLDIVSDHTQTSTKAVFAVNNDLFQEERILGNLKFNHMKYKLWDYFRWGFKCSASCFSDHSYLRSWNYWRTVLTLLSKILLDDFEGIDHRLSSTTMAIDRDRIVKSIFYSHARDLNSFNFRLGSLDLIDIAFPDNHDTVTKPIFDNDLKVVASYVPLKEKDESNVFETTLGIDSIQLRKTLLYMGYHCLTLSNNRHDDVDEYLFAIGRKLIKLPYADFLEFFSTYDAKSSELERTFLICVSFSCAQLLTSMLEDFYTAEPLFIHLKRIPLDVLTFFEEATVTEISHASRHFSDTKKLVLILNYWISSWGSTKTRGDYSAGMNHIMAAVKKGESKRAKVFRNLFPYDTPELPSMGLSELLKEKFDRI